MDIHRRQFIQQSVAAGMAVAAAPYLRAGESERNFRTCIIGSGWWGRNILHEAMASRRCKVTGICDVDEMTRETTAEQVTDLSGEHPKKYGDFRELLAKEKPEIVIVATPDHWHGLITIEAVKSGAHVYVEKPTAHTIFESRAMLRVSRQADRVVQVGLHRRIGPHHVSAMKFLREGKAGKIGMVRLFAFGGGGHENPRPNSPPPEGLDWDFWCGPAPMRPFNAKLHPGGWREFLDFGNGQLGDWGVHWLDQVLWWTDEKYPRSVYSTGGRNIAGPAILNDREQTTDAPDHQVAVYEFESFTAIWEHRRFAENHAERHRIGAYFYGTEGTLHIGWQDGWTFYPNNTKAPTVHEESQLQSPDGHNIKLLWADFLGAIDTGRKPVADIEPSHRSSVLPLLGMISMRVGRSLHWDGSKEEIVGDPEASKLMTRPYRTPWIGPSEV